MTRPGAATPRSGVPGPRRPGTSPSGGADPFRLPAGAVALDVLLLGPRGELGADLPGWRSWTGRSTPLSGFAWWDDVHPDDRTAVLTCDLADSRPGRLVAVPFRLRTADGGHRHLLARVLALPAADGGVASWVGRVDDVTDAPAAVRRETARAAAEAALARTSTLQDVLGCAEDVLLDLVGARSCRLVRVATADEPATTLRLTRRGPGVAPGSAGAGDAVLPLAHADEALGVWHLEGLLRDATEPDERTFLVGIAAALAQALARGQLLERSRATARTLQRALLPERLPEVPGLQVAVRYRSSAGSEVGGDWYDVLPLADGNVGLVLGDVMGRGVRAACTMGQVRNALRGIAVLDPTPVGMLGALDRFFEAFADDEITTVLLTVLDPRSGVLHVANAGHLPPLILRAEDGRVGYLDDGASTPLGVPTVRVACKGTTLRHGDILVMCSDGLIERRHTSLDEGLAVLAATARRLSTGEPDLEQFADALLAEVLDGSSTDDDVSLLVTRLI